MTTLHNNDILGQIAFTEDLTRHIKALAEIEEMREELKPIRYIRQPSTKVYSLLHSVTIAQGYKSVNDLIDDLARLAFVRTFKHNKTIKGRELK